MPTTRSKSVDDKGPHTRTRSNKGTAVGKQHLLESPDKSKSGPLKLQREVGLKEKSNVPISSPHTFTRVREGKQLRTALTQGVEQNVTKSESTSPKVLRKEITAPVQKDTESKNMKCKPNLVIESKPLLEHGVKRKITDDKNVQVEMNAKRLLVTENNTEQTVNSMLMEEVQSSNGRECSIYTRKSKNMELVERMEESLQNGESSLEMQDKSNIETNFQKISEISEKSKDLKAPPALAGSILVALGGGGVNTELDVVNSAELKEQTSANGKDVVTSPEQIIKFHSIRKQNKDSQDNASLMKEFTDTVEEQNKISDVATPQEQIHQPDVNVIELKSSNADTGNCSDIKASLNCEDVASCQVSVQAAVAEDCFNGCSELTPATRNKILVSSSTETLSLCQMVDQGTQTLHEISKATKRSITIESDQGDKNVVEMPKGDGSSSKLTENKGSAAMEPKRQQDADANKNEKRNLKKVEERTEKDDDRRLGKLSGEESETPVRKSGRRSIPNRRYQDMELDFGKKKSKENKNFSIKATLTKKIKDVKVVKEMEVDQQTGKNADTPLKFAKETAVSKEVPGDEEKDKKRGLETTHDFVDKETKKVKRCDTVNGNFVTEIVVYPPSSSTGQDASPSSQSVQTAAASECSPPSTIVNELQTSSSGAPELQPDGTKGLIDLSENDAVCITTSVENEGPTRALSVDGNCLESAQFTETEAAVQEITRALPNSLSSHGVIVENADDMTGHKMDLTFADAVQIVSQATNNEEDFTQVESDEVEEDEVDSIKDLGDIGVLRNSVATAVASTQTPLNVRKKTSVITKNGPTVKTITVNVQQPEGLSLDADSETSPSGTQEFIIVHLPEGAQIKRPMVEARSRVETLVGVRIDENGVYKCTECSYFTSKKANWYKHRKKHLGIRPHSCPKCSYKATTSSNLKRHIAIHADVREYQCIQCSLLFRQKIHLERHMKYKHEEKKVQCPFCDYVCANENPDLKIHIRRKHVPTEDLDGTMQTFTCMECGLVAVTKKDLKQHMKFHKKGPELKLFCEQCSFVTDCESRLRRHVLTHSKVKPFKCGLCEYRGSQKEHVVRHMKSRHQIEIVRNPRRPKDDENSGDGNDRDQGDFTSRDKIFACNHCTMKFSKLINLYKHLHAQHKTVMPPSSSCDEFYCVVCDFKTNSKKNLLVHMRKHNTQEQNPPSHVYSCVLCRYVNPKRRNLFQHMKKKHGIEIVMKDDWSSNCFIAETGSNVLDRTEVTEQNVMTIGDVTSDDTNQLMVVTDDSDANSGVQTVITIEDIASSMTNPVKSSDIAFSFSQSKETDTIAQQHAAEAIEGLKALAEQPGIVGTEGEVAEEQEENVADRDQLNSTVSDVEEMKVDNRESIELSAEQIVHLSTGDFVEINGEMYKVEISTEPAEETVMTTEEAESAVENTNSELCNELHADT